MKKEIILAPSILAADFNILGKQIAEVEQSGVKYLHIDVMDGIFVPSISFGMPLISSIRKNTGLIFDVHLMIENPERYIGEFKKCGADIITVHAEACRHLNRTVQEIKEAGMKCSVSLNPATPLNVLDYVLSELDMVLIMSVNPGFGGQSFIESTYNKLRALREKADRVNPDLDIEVDGGVSTKNAKAITEAGANVLVAGSSVFNGDISGNIRDIMAAVK